MTVRLRGITWDHSRGYDPLAGNVHRFATIEPGIEVAWCRRSLRDFGVQPVEDLAEQFDLLIIDHPFCGRADRLGCLLDLRPLFPASFHEMLARESVGPSTRSYDFAGALYALPTDAAAQVASYRPDLMSRLGYEHPPRTFTEVIDLGRRARAAGMWLAMPSCQSDAACLVATLSANLGHPIQPEADHLLEPSAFAAVLDYLEQLAHLSHPSSRDWNPIATYNAMSRDDEIVYVPFAFGYTNYARQGVEKPIQFTTVAGPGADPQAGAILGGAGCAISARSKNVDAAVTYLTWLHQPEHQAGDYYREGGQPGLRSAWLDDGVNKDCRNFFRDTLETLDKSFLRPRFDGFIPAFEHMGLLVHHWLKAGGDKTALIRDANDTYGRASETAAKRQTA